MSGQPQYQSIMASIHVPALPDYQSYASSAQNPVVGKRDAQTFPSQVSAPSEHESSVLTSLASTPTAPTPPPDTNSKVVLLLLLDHGTEWASASHQDLIHQLESKNYHVTASSPATAALSIRRYNSSIILLYEAKTRDKTCDRKILTDRLQEFTNAGGILIFGGVPLALNQAKKAKAKTFITAFGLDWTVAEDDLTMVVGACSDMMQESTLNLHSTYLHNIPIGCRVYRPYPHNDKDEKNMEEPCPVVLQEVGDGCMGFIGSKDLYSEDSKTLLVKMLTVAEGLVKCKDGKTPAEVMMGGKKWTPYGFIDVPEHDVAEVSTG